jgi:hypothetical protein
MRTPSWLMGQRGSLSLRGMHPRMMGRRLLLAVPVRSPVVI